MIALVIIAAVLALVIFGMANAPVMCETQEEAKWVTENFIGLLNLEKVAKLRDPQYRKKAIDNLGVRGWEYDDHQTCDEFIIKILNNYENQPRFTPTTFRHG